MLCVAIIIVIGELSFSGNAGILPDAESFKRGIGAKFEQVEISQTDDSKVCPWAPQVVPEDHVIRQGFGKEWCCWTHHRSNFLPGQNGRRNWKSSVWGRWGWRDVVIYLNPYQHHVSDTACLLGVRKDLATVEDCHANTILWRLMYLPNIFLEVCGN